MTTKLQETIQEVLKYINKARELMGLDGLLDLPKGRKENAGQCPVARALTEPVSIDISVDNDWINFFDSELACDIARLWDTGYTSDGVSTPTVISDFIEAFDSGYLPEYDMEPDPEDEDEGEEDPDEPDVDF